MKNKSIKLLILLTLIILLFFGMGCVGYSTPKPYDIPEGQPDSYEINLSQNNFTNSTTFFLYSNKTVRVVATVVNTSSLEIIKPEEVSFGLKSEKGPGIKDFVVVGSYASDNQSNRSTVLDISYRSTYSKSSNRKKLNIEFAEPVTGFIAYSYTQEYGQFYHFLSRNETVTIFLPRDHRTGNIILGSPRPAGPDERFIDNNGRVGLIWNNPYPEHKWISVKYYKTSLPVILSIVGAILVIAFLISALYFHNKIIKLRQKREAMEEDMRKKS